MCICKYNPYIINLKAIDMAKLGISIKIDVTKILKERLFKGEKGTYLDLTTFIDTDQPDQYGNHGFISQSVNKQEKAAGVQTPILGNSKIFYSDVNNSQQAIQNQIQQPQQAPQQGFQPQVAPQQGFQPQAPQAAPQQPAGFDDFSDDLPF